MKPGNRPREIKTASQTDDRSSWSETIDRFPTDSVLRKAGFRIVERIGRQEPVWERYGVRMKQRIALDVIENESKQTRRKCSE